MSMRQFFGDLMRLRIERCLKKRPKSKQPKSKHLRQHLPKVCVHLFHGQEEDQFEIFWDCLVQFRLEIMCQEGFWEVQIFGFFWSESSNLEGPKLLGVDVETGLKIRKYKYLMKEFLSMKCRILCGGLSGNICLLIFKKISMVFRWG